MGSPRRDPRSFGGSHKGRRGRHDADAGIAEEKRHEAAGNVGLAAGAALASAQDGEGSLDRTEALLAIAQIALGLAGFGGVFVAVGRREPGPRSPADTYRLVLLQSTALVTLFLSLLPIVLAGLGAADDVVWRVSSGILAVALTVMLIGTQKLRRRHDAEIREGEQRAVAAGIWVVSCVLLVAQVPNVLGWFGARAFGVFFLALVFLVAFGSYLFARMLFLWRS